MLKSRITQSQVVLRRAYGRYSTYLPRRASFCGSINKEEFLTDTTGNRRYLPFTVHDITIDETKDVLMCYAQAFALFKNGYNIYISPEEIKEIEGHNEDYRNISMEEELILTNYDKPTEDEYQVGFDSNIKWRTTTDIANELATTYNKLNVNDSYKKKIGQAMTKLGFKRMTKRLKDLGPIKVWAVKQCSRDMNPLINHSSMQESII